MLFCPLFSGSSGNATYIEAGNVRLLVDAGAAGIRVENALKLGGFDPRALNAILVTHEHTDHVAGVGILSRKYGIPVYANAACFLAMEKSTGTIAPHCTRVFETNRDFFIGEVNVLPFSTPHDAVEPVGYTFTHNRCKAGVLTDIGCMEDRLYDAVDGCELLLLESNHDIDMLNYGPYPYPLKQRILSRKGHLSNDDCGAALTRLYARGLRHAILGHLSKDNNRPELALKTVGNALTAEGVYDMSVMMSYRDRPCGVFHLE